MSTSLPEQTAAGRLDDPLDHLPLRERKKLKTRRAIQEHALRLFTARGYDATTVEQIAAAAEVSPSTFFRYFPTKEDLVVTDEYDPVLERLLRAQPPELAPLEALRASFREVFPYVFQTDMETIRTRVRLIAEVPSVQARVHELMRGGTLAVLAGVTAERTGREPDDPRVQAFAWAVMGVLQAAMYTWLDGDGAADLPGLLDRNLEFLGAGMPL
ncbi:acyl-CoA-like ligand-binding transcription factor [Actinomadura hibisca]|uniref:acyl-CoA-like ligand-binding transcription factor n=1 Tax=Actinomadura hibisca TaxID=68565 RepID=UPI000A037FB3|nr:TetR family transcriptional regulator [Actinomadura hibisca]